MSNDPNVFTNTEERVRKGVTRAAQGAGKILGKPKEPEADKLAPAPPEPDLDNLLLLPEIIQLLEPPLEKLGFSLKTSRTRNKFDKKMIDHHEIETRDGKIALIYVTPEVLERYRDKVTSLGLVFAEESRSGAFIFSRAENLERYYKPTIDYWQVIFQKVAIFLQEDIVDFEEMDEEFLQDEIKEKFALPDQQASSSEIDLGKLRNLLNNRLKKAELESLCFVIEDLDFDNLEGKTKSNKIEAMISHFKNREQLQMLLDKIKDERPDIFESLLK